MPEYSCITNFETQTSSKTEYYFEIILEEELLNSAKDVEEYKLEYQKPASTICGVILDIGASFTGSGNSIETSFGDDSHFFYSDLQVY